MSLVGTRVRSTNIDIKHHTDYLAERWHMTPGLTGWCQLNMNFEQDDSTLNGLDFLYIANSSLLLDLKILLKTCARLALHPNKRKELALWLPE